MTRSMTGFGRATGALDEESFTVELSAVNHRFFECGVRLPNGWSVLEASLREIVRKSVSRGKINVYIRRDRQAGSRQVVCFDGNVAKQYVRAARELSQLMNTTASISLDVLAQMEGVFYQEEQTQDLDAIKAALSDALTEALAQFNAARASEGAVLAEDMVASIRAMAEAVATVEARIPALNAEYEARLHERVAELNVEAGLKEDRLALEVALLADKTAVNEEVVRLKAHFERASELLASDEPVGRDLNFLTQEIQREINTLGSKLRDVGVTREVLGMKSELEKLREQVQNVE